MTSWLEVGPGRRDWSSRPAVLMSPDLKRIINLARRPPPDLDGPTGEALVELMTGRLRRDNDACKCATWGRQCITRLKPAQAWALYEAPLANGLLAPIGVGHGKTGLDILIALVMRDCKQAVLLIPPGLREQLVQEYLAWGEHFRVPSLTIGGRGWIKPGTPSVHVVPYSMFCRAGATDLLEKLKPDLIIADEAHKLRHRGTTTTGRVLRYWINNPETRLAAWSGTMTSRSISDYAHLSALALKNGSPLPLDPGVVDEWSMAIDPSDDPAPAGALSLLGDDDAQKGFHRRLVETRGVTATTTGAVGASLYLYERTPPPMPETVKEMLTNLRATWVRPDDEVLVDAAAEARAACELACGFYYHWVFPRGEPPEVIAEWRAARKAWHRELREKLSARQPHLDSPLLCAKAAIRFYAGCTGDLPVWRSDTWPRWRDVRDTVEHKTEAVWVDDWLAKDAAAWARQNRGVVWYAHDAFGKRVAELAGLPQHAGGVGAEQFILAEKGDRSVVASIAAHGTGRDGLQRLFSNQLVTNPMPSGATWEQLLGRLHRVGQAADEVNTWVYRHTPEMAQAVDSAVRTAKYIEATLGSSQKLLAATVDFALTRAAPGVNI